MDYVNVIELNEGVVQSNKLFTGKDAGTKAEEYFVSIIKENTDQIPSAPALDAHLDNGYYEDGTWMVTITWPQVA